jgi:hypothetical protein
MCFSLQRVWKCIYVWYRRQSLPLHSAQQEGLPLGPGRSVPWDQEGLSPGTKNRVQSMYQYMRNGDNVRGQAKSQDWKNCRKTHISASPPSLNAWRLCVTRGTARLHVFRSVWGQCPTGTRTAFLKRKIQIYRNLCNAELKFKKSLYTRVLCINFRTFFLFKV